MWIRLRTLKNSFRYAWKGVKAVFKSEQNFRIQVLISILVVFGMFFFQVRAVEAVALILMILLVLILEILNTVVERFIDILQPRLNHYSEKIKDMMAAAVLLAALGSCIIGFLIFYPYLLPLFT